jgi:hypothetical protein
MLKISKIVYFTNLMALALYQNNGQLPLEAGELLQPVGDDPGEQVPVSADWFDGGPGQVRVPHRERVPLPSHRGT